VLGASRIYLCYLIPILFLVANITWYICRMLEGGRFLILITGQLVERPRGFEDVRRRL
jgi:hypothetical protein